MAHGESKEPDALSEFGAGGRSETSPAKRRANVSVDEVPRALEGKRNTRCSMSLLTVTKKGCNTVDAHMDYWGEHDSLKKYEHTQPNC